MHCHFVSFCARKPASLPLLPGGIARSPQGLRCLGSGLVTGTEARTAGLQCSTAGQSAGKTGCFQHRSQPRELSFDLVPKCCWQLSPRRTVPGTSLFLPEASREQVTLMGKRTFAAELADLSTALPSHGMRPHRFASSSPPQISAEQWRGFLQTPLLTWTSSMEQT